MWHQLALSDPLVALCAGPARCSSTCLCRQVLQHLLKRRAVQLAWHTPCFRLNVHGCSLASCGRSLVCCSVQTDGKLKSEIVAHSRWLSAMDIHPKEDIIVTAAEDATMNVWQLPIGGNKVGCDLTSTLTTTYHIPSHVYVSHVSMSTLQQP